MWDFERLKREGRKEKKVKLCLFLLAGLVLVLFVTGGCDLAERLQTLRQNRLPVQSGELPDLVTEDLGPFQETEKTKIALYFKDQEGRYLVAETQEITKVPGIGRAALEALFQGPAEKDLRPSVPNGTELRDLNVRSDGMCIADISREVTQIPGQDPRAEALTVYAIVNTLTEFPTIEKVQILVEGQLRKTLAGHIPIDDPLLRNLTFVKS